MGDHKVRNILVIVLGVVLVGVFIWLKITSSKNVGVNTNTSKELINSHGEIGDYKSFFSITSVMSDYDLKLSDSDESYLVNVLNKEYLNNNSYNSSNIIDALNPNHFGFEHYIKDITYNCNTENCFFFFETIGKRIIFGDLFPENLNIERFLITVDLSKATYDITPLMDVTDLKSYMDSYNYKEITIDKNENNSFSFVTTDDTQKLNYYLDFLECALLFDRDAAEQRIDNYNPELLVDYLNYSTNIIYSYKKVDIVQGIEYSGTLLDGTSFTLYDYSPMNFKISFQ